MVSATGVSSRSSSFGTTGPVNCASCSAGSSTGSAVVKVSGLDVVVVSGVLPPFDPDDVGVELLDGGVPCAGVPAVPSLGWLPGAGADDPSPPVTGGD